MDNYWENRYKSGGNSGAGSYGDYAKHKADVVNKYINKFKIKTISDFGCGDGNQLKTLYGYENYYGFDVSSHIIENCKQMFINDNIKFFSNINNIPNADLCLSLDVIYHILDENDYVDYLMTLFEKSNKYVLIFSSNHSDNSGASEHIFHRKFTDWVKNNQKNFELIDEIDNDLKTSAKFFLFKKQD